MSSGSVKASIPNTIRATIQNIKEITGNHSEEDIYAMLKECSMDPNETTQKLLLQDTFHEVKRKKDRKKENLNNRESSESRWRSGPPGRGGRGSWMNSSPHTSNGATGGQRFGHGKDYVVNQIARTSSLSASLETKNREKSSVTSSSPATVHGPDAVESGLIVVTESASVMNVGSTASSNNSSLSGPASSAAVAFSSSTSVLEPSIDLKDRSDAGGTKGEVGSQHSGNEKNADKPSENESSESEIGNSSILGENIGKPQYSGKNHLPDSSQPSFAITDGSSSISRPSSSYSSRSQQIMGPQRASSNKEWKPKTTIDVSQGIASVVVPEVSATSAEAIVQKESVSSEEATSTMLKKLENFHLPQRQHVILPDHIYVPESEKTKFSFGSLGANFGLGTGHVDVMENDNSSVPLSETSLDAEQAVEVPTRNQNDWVTQEVEVLSEHPQAPADVPENTSSSCKVVVSSGSVKEFSESKEENTLPAGGNQHTYLPNSSNYSLGFMPPVLGTQFAQFAQFENSESQARDGSRLPSFVVPQPFDLASYYAHFYHSGANADGRVSPFSASGVNHKYNDNSSVLPTPTSQSLQEGGVLSTASPTPLVTQAAGLMQSSVTVTPQPVPVFRPPTGVHLPHYPANYFPYGHYISPFYAPLPVMHQFLGNGAFPQQPHANTVYAPPSAVTATGIKYPLPQYKTGTNAGNPPHVVMQSAYGTYGSSSAGYNPSSTANAGSSTSNEDIGASQFKENKVYIGGQQQSEGSAVWVTTPGREFSSLPTSSFYNLPPQGQHVTFTPAQTGTFTGMYHPAQAVTAATVHPLLQQSQTLSGAVDMVGPGGSVYQQSQHAQMNWPNNY